MAAGWVCLLTQAGGQESSVVVLTWLQKYRTSYCAQAAMLYP